MLYQTHKKELYGRDIALELEKIKIPNVLVQKSKIKKEYDSRYSEENRIRFTETYMKKRNAGFIIDLHDAYRPDRRAFKKPIVDNNGKVIWDGLENWRSREQLADIDCHWKERENVRDYLKSYKNLIEVDGYGITPHPHYYIIDFMPHRKKSESLEFIKHFINYIQS